MTLSTTNPSQAAQHPQPVQKGVFYAEHSPRIESPSYLMAEAMPAVGRGVSQRKRMKHMSKIAEGGTFADDLEFARNDAPLEMSVHSAVIERAGDLGASFEFQLQHPVNISSSERVISHSSTGSMQTGPRKLLVDTLKLKSIVFSYAVPSVDRRAFLRAWGNLPEDRAIPIIPSGVSQFYPLSGVGSARGGGRIFIQGTYSGETSVEAVQPGGMMRISLGQDKNIEVKNTPILAKNSNKEEDKSTWLVTDKSKYHVKTEEFALYAKSTHTGPMLVILAESIPVSTEEDVRVEILSPDPKMISRVDDTHSGQGDSVLEAIFAIVGREPPSGQNKLHVFLSRETGNMYWVRWLNPTETIISTLKYTLTWPEKKDIVVV